MSVLVAELPVCEMDKDMKEKKKGLLCILMLFMSPIAIFLLILIALWSFSQFLLKAMLLFGIVAINTPFAMMINSSILVVNFLRDSSFDPRVTVAIEFKTIVSNFFKLLAAEFLLIMSTGVITYYTAPIRVFYISMAGGVTAIVLKWLNTSSLSKTAFSCLCSGFGLNPMMFFFSFIGLFDIGCHPIAKCSFLARRAFLFIEAPNLCIIGNEWKSFITTLVPNSENSSVIESIEFPKWNAFERGLFQLHSRIDFHIRLIEKKKKKKCILKSFMVLKLPGWNLSCEYPKIQRFLSYEYLVERLELPEDYSKVNELYNFLVNLSSQDGFVTNRMRGRYEHSLTLLEIVDGVKKSTGYKIMKPMDERFVVAGCSDVLH